MLYCANIAKHGDVEKLDISGSDFLEYFPTLNTTTINEQLRIIGYSIIDTSDGKTIIANSDSHREFVLNTLTFSPIESQKIIPIVNKQSDDERECCGKCTGFCH